MSSVGIAEYEIFNENIIVAGIVFLLEIFLITGKGPTMYLYFRKHFSWDAEGFGVYIGVFGILGIFGIYWSQIFCRLAFNFVFQPNTL